MKKFWIKIKNLFRTKEDIILEYLETIKDDNKNILKGHISGFSPSQERTLAEDKRNGIDADYFFPTRTYNIEVTSIIPPDELKELLESRILRFETKREYLLRRKK